MVLHTLAVSWPQLGLSFSEVAPSWHQIGLSWPQAALSCRHFHSGLFQVGPKWAARGGFGVTLEHFGGQMVALDHFEATFWHMAVILVHLGSFGGHSGVALGHFGVTVASL